MVPAGNIALGVDLVILLLQFFVVLVSNIHQVLDKFKLFLVSFDLLLNRLVLLA
jgi:hypothetical protein